MMRRNARPVTSLSVAARRAASERKYRRDPGRFRGRPSPFARWAYARRSKPRFRGRLLELGCGPGRDLLFFLDRGLQVQGVDFSSTAIARAREAVAHRPLPERKRATLTESEAIGFLRRVHPGTYDAVYAHLAYGALPLDELVELFALVRRALRIGGLHLYAARDTRDPNCGRGRQVAPNVWFGGPHDVPFRYFTPGTCATLGRGFFRRVATGRSRSSHLLYVIDQRVA
jgi:SAM-dependent methyltransferase